MESYVTFDATGNLTGSYLQEISPEHYQNYILVDANVRANWPLYRANSQRDGVELIPIVIDLDALKRVKNVQINQWRADANLTSFVHLGKQIACDALSRSDIEGVAGNISLMGSFPAGFPNAWKAMDNTYIQLPTVAAFKDMYASMTAQGTTNFARSLQLKTMLSSAQSVQEIDAIKWET